LEQYNTENARILTIFTRKQGTCGGGSAVTADFDGVTKVRRSSATPAAALRYKTPTIMLTEPRPLVHWSRK